MRKRSRKMFQKNVLVIFCLTLLLSPFGTAFGGSVEQVQPESSKDAMEIMDVEGLNDMRSDLGGSYILGADIDLSDEVEWESVGNKDNPFTGEFNGSGFKITGMDVAFEGADHNGVFGAVSDDASVKELVVEFKEKLLKEEEVPEKEEMPKEENGSEEIKTEKETSEVELQEPISQSLKMKPLTEDEEEGNQLEFSGDGSGSVEDPYLITNADQLDEIRYHLDKNFKLIEDIDLSSFDNWEPIRKDITDITADLFSGTLDGNNKTISNLKIYRPNEHEVGLFSVSIRATISNLNLTEVDVVGRDNVGALVGYDNSSNFNNINVTGKVTGNFWTGGLLGRLSGQVNNSSISVNTKGANNVGGIVGLANHNSVINNSIATGEVLGSENVGGLIGSSNATVEHSSATGNVTGTRDNVGGLVGRSNKKIVRSFATGDVQSTRGGATGGLVGRQVRGGEIEDTFATGKVTGISNVGGLVGYHEAGPIKKSYATGSVTAIDSHLGGLIGESTATDTMIVDSFYDSETTRQTDNDGRGFPKLTADMQNQATFTNWDFDEVWGINEGEYPHLQFYGGQGSQPSDEPILLNLDEEKEVQVGSTVKIAGTDTTIVLPEDLPAGTKLEVELVTPEAPGLTQSGEVFNFIFTFPDGFGFEDIDGDFILTLGIDNDAESEKVAIYHYNETTEAWELVGGNVEGHLITITVTDFSQYGVFSADGDIIYVKEGGAGTEDGTSWDHAFATLQEALDEATDGKQIWIAKGTYYPTKAIDVASERTKTFQMKNGVAIYGGFVGSEAPDADLGSRDFTANETILSGDLGTQGDKSDNAYHVFYHPDGTNLDETAVLDGVTITGGNANHSSSNPPHASRGGGMYNENSSPTINNVNISNNFASDGAGMYNKESNPTLTNMIITKNLAGHGAGIMNISSSPTLTKVMISKNEAAGDNGGGGGMMNRDGSHPMLTEVEIIDNEANGQYGAGGGIYTLESSTTLTNVRISNNSATESGGGVYNKKIDNFEMTGGEITENTTFYGGGMYNDNSSPTLTDVMISKNTASDNGGGIANLNESSPFLTNVQILGNTGDDGGGIANEFESNPTITNSLISGNKSLDSGSGMFNNESKPTLINVTISHNIGDHGSEGMYNFDANPIIQNSIIWGHDESINNSGGTPEIKHSLIEGSGGSGASWNVDFGTDEGGNLDLDPKFIDGANGDYRLLAGSPAINAGNDAFVPVGITTDLDGNARFVGTVDMGAYEFPPVLGEDVIAIYVDEDDQEIANAETHSGNIGDAYTTVEKVIAGYTFKEVIGDVTGTFTADPQEVKYVYTKDESDREITSGSYSGVPLKTGWYDINDLPLREKIEVSLNDGSKVELAVIWNMVSDPVYDKDVEGSYLFSGEFVLIDGVSNPNGYKAQERYVLTDSVVNVMYEDEDGNELAANVTLKGHLNAPYTTEEKEFPGYTLTKQPDNATGTFLRNDQTVTYVYSKNPGETLFTVTVVHVNEDGNEIASTEIHSGNIGDPYTTVEKVIPGYTLKEVIGDVTGTFTADAQEVKYVYTKDVAVVPDNEITGFKWSGTTLDVGTRDRDHLPLPDKVQVTLDDNSKVDLVVSWEADSETPYDMNSVGTYIFNGDFKLIDGVINSKGFKAKFNIILKDDNTPVPESSVVVTHVDEDGEKLAPSKVLTGAEGEVYSTEAEEIEGYTFIKVNGNKSGIFTKNSIFVEYVYGLDLVDPDKDKEITNVPIIGATFGLGTEDLANIVSNLPSTVKVTLDDGTEVEIGVKWNEESDPIYDKNKVGAYFFSGEFLLPEGIANTANHIMIYQVNVFDYDDPVDPTDPTEPNDKDRNDDETDKKDDPIIIPDKDDGSGQLPKTATSYYTMLLAGLLLTIIGGTVYFIVRRKRVL